MSNTLSDVQIGTTTLNVQQIVFEEGLPYLIFLHDSLGCVALWRDFPKQLGELVRYNVLIYDRQGYGKSAPFNPQKREKDYMEIEADVLIQLMDKFNIRTAWLFGHSDGGSIALIAAAKHPDRIAGIVTEGAHIFVEEISLNGIRSAVEDYRHTDMKQRLERYHGDKTEAVFNAWAVTWLNEAFHTWTLHSFLPKIHCPTLVIQGENDEYGSIDQVNGIVELVAGRVEAFMVPHVGHTPHRDARSAVMERTARFMQLN